MIPIKEMSDKMLRRKLHDYVKLAKLEASKHMCHIDEFDEDEQGHVVFCEENIPDWPWEDYLRPDYWVLLKEFKRRKTCQ